MGCLGNALWFVLGGFFSWLGWMFFGVLWSITIIGIPIGRQCFKFAKLSAFPFGKEVEFGGGSASLLVNILWLLLGGIEMAFAHLFWGVLLSITIIGIPFGKQHFKLAKLALMPFGARVVEA